MHVKTTKDTPPPFYTAAEVAERYRLSLRKVREMVASGELKALRIGRAVRIPLKALEGLEAAGQ